MKLTIAVPTQYDVKFANIPTYLIKTGWKKLESDLPGYATYQYGGTDTQITIVTKEDTPTTISQIIHSIKLISVYMRIPIPIVVEDINAITEGVNEMRLRWKK